jgi:hypothetical protein
VPTLLKFGIFAVLAVTAKAVPITIVDTVLDNVSTGNPALFIYTGFDGNGTTLTVARSPAGSFDPRQGGTYPGLWIGSSNGTSVYSFQFNTPVQFAEFYVTAATGMLGATEVFDAFSANTAVTLGFTNISTAAFDGSSITSLSGDTSFRIRLTATGGPFTTFSFKHTQSGVPNGSVIQEIIFDPAATATPEPSTFAIGALGLAALAVFRGRTR